MIHVSPKLRRPTVLALVALFVVSCRPASALDEADLCFRDKLRASRIAAATSFACLEDDEIRSARCRQRAERRLDRLLSGAEARAAARGFVCPAGAHALGLAGPWPWPARFIEQAANGGREDCNRLQARAARRFSTEYARCLDVGLEDPASVGSCASGARAAFEAGWNAASASGPCPGETALAALGRLQATIDETAARLQIRCGDGHVAGFEQCDDGGTTDDDGCDASCRIETCARVGGEVLCAACPAGSVPTATFDGCRCPDGFEGEPGACRDIDECAANDALCADRNACVNLEGTWACAVACTAEAFHAALASCGAPSGAIAFDCQNKVITIPAAQTALRDVRCSDLTIDGAGRNIAFQLDPLCWRTPLFPEQCPDGLAEDGTCACPDVDSGDQFLLLRGDRNVVRDLTVRGFFEGIPAAGHGNVVEHVRFDRMCDDAFGSVATGVGNVFRHLTVRRGCDKCSENGGSFANLDPDPRTADHYNAVLSDIEFDSCRTPVRVASSGRFLLENLTMHATDPKFPCDGPRFSAAGDGDDVVIRMRKSTVEDCRRGIRFGRGTGAVLSDSRIAYGGLRGLHLSSTAQVSVERTTIERNGGGRSSETGFGGVAVMDLARIDLGGGALQIDGGEVRSAGDNTLCDNQGPNGDRLDLENATSEAPPAGANWWCSLGDPWGRIVGPAAVDPVLDRAPLAYRPSR